MQVTDEWLASLARALNTKLKKVQGDAIRAILFECDRQEVKDARHIAYILATAYHECRFLSIPEIRAKAGSPVWKMQEAYWYTGFYGRGLCQLTWERNYRKFAVVAGVDLVQNPDKMLDVAIGAKVLVFGMMNGSFTALNLSSKNNLTRYFNDKQADFMGARRIVNGTFQADKVRDAALKILPLIEHL